VDDFLPDPRPVPARRSQIIVDAIASRGALVMLGSHSGCLADGRPYENLYAWAVEVRDGKIYALREYFDSHYVVGLMAAGPAR
jgi:ketosteroid isomerase-like protein